MEKFQRTSETNAKKTALKYNKEHSKTVNDLLYEDTIDYAETPFQLKIKEALHILWDKPILNQQVKYVNLKLFL